MGGEMKWWKSGNSCKSIDCIFLNWRLPIYKISWICIFICWHATDLYCHLSVTMVTW